MPLADENVLARLAGRVSGSDGDAQTVVLNGPPEREVASKEAKLDDLLKRIQGLTGGKEAPAAPSSGKATPVTPDAFVPVEPHSFRAAGLTESEVAALILS
jgi:hypothetical protein